MRPRHARTARLRDRRPLVPVNQAGIEHLAQKYGERWLFVGPPRAQATPQYFRWPELVAVTDVASARRAIGEILEQGEGPRGDWRNAHFGQSSRSSTSSSRLRESDRGLPCARWSR